MSQGYKVGEVAAMFGLHPDTLRYYEEQGLLAPRRQANGYRSYSIQDVCTLNVIRRLRQLELPMERICDYMRQRSLAQTLALLADEQQIIQDKIAQLQGLLAETKSRQAALEASRQLPVDQPALHTLPPRNCYRLETPTLPEPQVDMALKKLEHRRPELNRLVGARMMGAVLDAASLERGVYDRYSAVLFLGEQFRQWDYLLPGGRYATLCYAGEYTGIVPAIARLRRFVSDQGLRPVGELLELYHVDVHDTLNPREYLTELQWQVAKDGG